MVTGQPDVDNDNDYDKDNDIDYDSTEDVALSSSAPSSTNSYPKVDCDDDDYVVECSSNRNVKICAKQFCDGVTNCPKGEDESPEECQSGEFCI